MKILLLTNHHLGLYLFRYELVAELLKEHTVYLSLPDGELVRPLEAIGAKFIDTPIDRRGINPITDLKLFRRYRKMLSQIKPDLVITYTVKPNIYGGLACRLAHVPYAANITGLGTAFQKRDALRMVVSTLYKVALKQAKVVFFENCGNQQTLLDEHIVKPMQCCLLNGAGVNLERYAYADYPQDDGEIRFLFTGRLMREKGVDELFSAMNRLHNEGVHCSLDMLGLYEENYASQIKDGEKAGWLRFHGYQQDVRPFITNCHCFVLPSWHEGMANTNLECAAMGRPLITSRIHGCMEAVVEGESGLLCEVQNAESLYETMKAFCQLPYEKRADMGTAGRHHMETSFDKRKIVEETIHHL